MVSAILDMVRYKRIKEKFENVFVLHGKNKHVFFFAFFALFSSVYPGLVGSAGQGLISLEVRDETLEKTLARVSKISGYTIYLQSEWRDLSVTVSLKNLTLEQAIRKILNNRINHAIVWNDIEKNIIITGVETSPGRKGVSGDWQQKELSGQGIRFEQGSRTTVY